MNVSGSMICVGRSNCFRFNHPEEAERMKTILPNARISSVPLHFSSAAGEPPGNYDPPPHPVSSRGRISRGGMLQSLGTAEDKQTNRVISNKEQKYTTGSQNQRLERSNARNGDLDTGTGREEQD